MSLHQSKQIAFKGLFAGALVASFVFAPAVVKAQSNTDSLLQDLDQRIRVLDRLREIDDENAKAAAAKAPKISAGEGGFGISSADGAYSIKFRNFVQVQGLFNLSNVGTAATTPVAPAPAVTYGIPAVNSFSVRRVQSDLTGGLGKQIDYRVQINYGGGAVDLLDVNLDWKILPEFSLRLGKFKPPTGLERLLSSYRSPFIEGSFVTALQPNRDIGAQAFGSIQSGLVDYQVGVFDGARDGQNNAADNNDSKDIYARVFAQPFLTSDLDLLTGLGLGVSGSYGAVAKLASNLPSYSSGRQTVFSYASADTSVGNQVRVSPQAYYYYGPLGVIGEYTQTTQSVRRSYTAATAPTTRVAEDKLTNSAWAVTASYFVTGEKNGYKSIKVKNPNTFPSFDGIGAIELIGRVHALKVDDKAFSVLSTATVPNQTQSYADPSKSVRDALGYGVAVKWYLNSNVNFFVAYENTKFSDGVGTTATATAAPITADRETEQVVSTAFNINF